MHCYLFDVRGDLLLDFPRTLSAIDEPLPTDFGSTYHLHKQEKDFYSCLDTDALRFRDFCHSPKDIPTSELTSDAVPTLLLFPKRKYAALIASRYVSQVLKGTEPLRGEVAYALGQETMHRLRERFANHHLIPTLAFSAMEELYHAASPLLALVPMTVQDMLAVLVENREPTSHPSLQAYYWEMMITDIPPMLDLFPLLTKLQGCLQDSLLFTGLKTVLTLPDCSPDIAWVRCPMSAFLYIYLLLNHTLASLSAADTVNLTLLPWENGIRLRFHAASLRLPGFAAAKHFTAENELYTLQQLCPSYAGILTLVQYFLHKHAIPFSCTWADGTLSVTLTMKTARQDTLEFHSGDLAAHLQTALPAAFALLASLLA